jgi:hypothetical protein
VIDPVAAAKAARYVWALEDMDAAERRLFEEALLR